ncbi:aspartyl/glutamyl-tRNA amidotransferase subunit C [Collinsella sp. AGMB00827]|uniref:Aspartyl/glutamyl-tRNA amidotransferase subunit C n=1 Tax=Collinsella ureilytica TaxID=2869515 RepID=A0ABS7MJP0_9ACTN|nr:Asp-tRNA(Asn)/Glu-tRNA(Gln) amidotransferase subunit GatC [Collinsella urealyticum]MBY4797301.1 aspartyl/glutamyl-tRNA amidotransferase subunit C [Collinsella urealyticum]
MALTEREVVGIADYARIALEGDELKQMTAYLNEAVQMLEPVLAYAQEDVDPTFHPIGELANVMREDVLDAERALDIKTATAGAASVRDRMFRVPAILAEGGEG